MTTERERMNRSLGAGAVLSGGCVAVSRAELAQLRQRNAELVELLRQARAMIDRLSENDHPGYEEWKALDDSIRAALEGR